MLESVSIKGYDNLGKNQTEVNFMSLFQEPISFEKLDEILHYDAETGVFLWKSKTAKKVLVGAEAGCIKRTKENGGFYRYIRVLGKSMAAARVAWCLHHGEWPIGKIFFADGDPLNLKINNLRLSNTVHGEHDLKTSGGRADYHRERRQTYYIEHRDEAMQTKFGLSLGEYGQMLVAQNGKCAICKGDETATRGGKTKALAVDHCHTTNKIRGLLCSECNQMLGKAKDNRATLLAAIEYLDKHTVLNESEGRA
jgi:hypothetical protein